MRRIPWAALASLPFLYLAACSGESTAPGAVDARPTLLPGTPAFLTGTPTFLTLLPSAPPLVSATVSFYAVRGQDREGTIFFQRPDGRPPTGSDRASTSSSSSRRSRGLLYRRRRRTSSSSRRKRAW